MDNYNSPLYMNRTDLLYRLKTDKDINVVWEELMEYRKNIGIEIPLIDQKSKNIFFVLTDKLKENIAKIDDLARQNIFEELDEETKMNVMLGAQADEAFYSSVIEGAHTTKKRTKDMIEKKEQPKNKDEQMVLNNYNALIYVLEKISNPISEGIILDIYHIITNSTLEIDEVVEKYRTGENEVRNLEEVIYIPPKVENVEGMMNLLIHFIRTESDERIHPILKAIIIHYYFVYIHPFYDGNGRTARALTYMYLIQNGYSFFKYFSISNLIKEARQGYYKSIKNSEDYESDMTYFAIFYTEMILKSIVKVRNDFKREYLKQVIKLDLEKRGVALNKRQEKIIEKTISFGKESIDIEFYRKTNKVTQETARKDLNILVEMRVYLKEKVGKKYQYRLRTNLDKTQ